MLQLGSLRPHVLRSPRIICLRARNSTRNKSITAAIERGRSAGDRFPDSRREQRREKDPYAARPSSGNRTKQQHDVGAPESILVATKPWKLDPDSIITYEPPFVKDNAKPLVKDDRGIDRSVQYQSKSQRRESAYGIGGRDHGDQQRDLPQRREAPPAVESLPYSTAASEFIYGYSSVLAALRANRRKLYTLYVHTRGNANTGKDAIIQRARSLKLNVKEVGDETLQALDKASSGRPHNGFVLEASPLPVPPLTSLLTFSIKSSTFDVALGKQSQEDLLVNGRQTKYPYKSGNWRHPLILYLDGVLDEGNLGATARSAYFLGVDAIVTPTRQSAPWSHIALKASAGAAEAIPIFKVEQGTEFLGQSARAGWRIYASDAVPAAEQPVLQGARPPSPSQTGAQSAVIYTQPRSAKRLPVEHCPVESYPTILMMGAEGTGLRSSLLNLAHFKVGIRHGRDVDEVGVDSLNVSVAAALLCYNMLQKPPPRASGNLLF